MTEKIFNVKALLLLGALLLAGCKSPDNGNGSGNENSNNENGGNETPAPEDSEIVNIPDANFLKFLIEDVKADKDGDGQINYGEARAITQMIEDDVKLHIKDLTGLEAFTNLILLEFKYGANNTYEFKEIPLTALAKLQTFTLNQSYVTDLDFGDNPNLKTLDFSAPRVKTIDLSKAPNVTDINAGSSNLVLKTIYVPKGFQKPAGWHLEPTVQIVEK